MQATTNPWNEVRRFVPYDQTPNTKADLSRGLGIIVTAFVIPSSGSKNKAFLTDFLNGLKKERKI